MRRKLVVGNWKMNGTRAMASALCADIVRGVGDAVADVADMVEIALCPPHILIPVAVDALAQSQISLGAQDLDVNPDGAFTGQVSASMLIDGGCRYVIVGHSERRTHYHESDDLVAQKTNAAVGAGLSAIICLGETLAQRESGMTEKVVAQQLNAVLDKVGVDALADAVFAYEPVWAIGTGLTASPDQAQQVHAFIREQIAARDAHIAAECRILYGGSMKPDNAAELIAKADIDGGLIGGAALNATDFLAICNAAATAD